MESSGMTQSGPGEVHAAFEPHLKDDVESMEDGQDPEVQRVHCFSTATFLIICNISKLFFHLPYCFHPQFGPMTVEIKSQKSKSDAPAGEAVARAPGLMDVWNIDPLQQGQALTAANKKRKKQQKRAGVYWLSSTSNTTGNINM